MSSSTDAGHAAAEAMKVINSTCPKTKDGKHKFDTHGSGPSTCGTCRLCGATYHWK